MPPSSRLADVLAIAVAGLDAAEGELELINETPMPAPDALTAALRRGETAEAVLRRVLRAAPADRRRRLGAMCREERMRHFGYCGEAMLGDGYPVMPDVLREVAEAQEQIRRAALTDADVRDAVEAAR